MGRYLVKADGPDAPGIVAAVTGALAERGCTLEDTSMTRLGGYFAMLLVIDAPDLDTPEQLREAFDAPVEQFDLTVVVEEIVETPDVRIPRGDRWEVTIYGSDRPSIVSAVTHRLAQVGANVEDLSTRMIGGVGPATYMVLIDVTLPPTVDGNALAAELAKLGQKLGISCHARHAGSDGL